MRRFVVAPAHLSRGRRVAHRRAQGHTARLMRRRRLLPPHAAYAYAPTCTRVRDAHVPAHRVRDASSGPSPFVRPCAAGRSPAFARASMRACPYAARPYAGLRASSASPHLLHHRSPPRGPSSPVRTASASTSRRPCISTNPLDAAPRSVPEVRIYPYGIGRFVIVEHCNPLARENPPCFEHVTKARGRGAEANAGAGAGLAQIQPNADTAATKRSRSPRSR